MAFLTHMTRYENLDPYDIIEPHDKDIIDPPSDAGLEQRENSPTTFFTCFWLIIVTNHRVTLLKPDLWKMDGMNERNEVI